MREYNHSYNYLRRHERRRRLEVPEGRRHRPSPDLEDGHRQHAGRHASSNAADPLNLFREFDGGAGWRRKSERVEPTRTVRNAERKALHVLGLELGVERAEIKARFKELVKRHHPDANGGDRACEDKLREIIQAYNYLKSTGAC